MAKDRVLGGLIFAACAIVMVFYVLGMFFYDPYIKSVIDLGPESLVRYWLVAVPVLIAFVAVLAFGAWIGWTMAATRPPKPIEEIASETKQDEDEEKKETEE